MISLGIGRAVSVGGRYVGVLRIVVGRLTDAVSSGLRLTMFGARLLVGLERLGGCQSTIGMVGIPESGGIAPSDDGTITVAVSPSMDGGPN